MITLAANKKHDIIKRDGRVEQFNEDKLFKVFLWAAEGSEIFAKKLLEAISIKINNRMRIEVLYDEAIDTASNLISDLYPQWETIARNLYILKLHKDIGCKRAEYPDYNEIVFGNESAGKYSTAFLDELSDLRINRQILADAIVPERDNLFTFGGLNLFVQKYCFTDKGQLLELPQHVYMRVAIQLMYAQGIEAIIAKYNQISTHSVTEATPKMVNSLSNSPSLFSCCMCKPTDSLEGIEESLQMLAKESKYGGGDAWDVSCIRAKGSIIKGNNGKSSGVIPYLQDAQATIGAYNQGGTRSSALIVSYNWFHYESPEIGKAKLESGKDEDRARKIKYAIKWNKHLSNAIRNDEYIYLIDPHKTQDLTYAYSTEWEKLYTKYSTDSTIHKRKYKARDLAFENATIKVETGNNYTFFTDNCNLQNIGTGTITSSNLCMEMQTSFNPIEVTSTKLLDTSMQTITYGDMSLCNLASINIMKWVYLDTQEKREFMYTLVSSMDNAIDNSFYANPLGQQHSANHRDLGIGISNYANYLATYKTTWSSQLARELTHKLMEEISYFAIEASIQLAKERSRCAVFADTKWAQGLFPHELSILPKDRKDLYLPLNLDWEPLRRDLLKYGIRNSRLLAIAPTATSGKCINATEGVDVPRKFKTIAEGTYSLPFVVPNLQHNREYYSTTFTTDNKDVIELAAIRQRFLCMSQSVSLGYANPNSAHEIVHDIMYAEELGLKTLYYTYTPTAGDDIEDEECEACGT